MSTDLVERLRNAIRDVPDFPSEGILFKDITPVLADGELFGAVVELFVSRLRDRRIDKVAAIDARGFILGGAMACELGCGFVPIRKKGKLPHETLSASYELEYGENTLEIHRDACGAGERLVLVDDLLATGGTAAAACGMIRELGAELVEALFLVELTFLHGRDKLTHLPVYAPVVY